MKKVRLLVLLRLFRGFRSVPGGRGPSPIPCSSFHFGLDALARWVVSFVTFRPELPPVPIGLRPASTRLVTPSRVSPPDAFTRLFASVLRRRHHATRLRFGVSFARDRLARAESIDRFKALQAGPVFSLARPARSGSLRRTDTECP